MSEPGATWRDVTVIFAAAACLGVAYNATSPLGVRGTPVPTPEV